MSIKISFSPASINCFTRPAGRLSTESSHPVAQQIRGRGGTGLATGAGQGKLLLQLSCRKVILCGHRCRKTLFAKQPAKQIQDPNIEIRTNLHKGKSEIRSSRGRDHPFGQPPARIRTSGIKSVSRYRRPQFCLPTISTDVGTPEQPTACAMGFQFHGSIPGLHVTPVNASPAPLRTANA